MAGPGRLDRLGCGVGRGGTEIASLDPLLMDSAQQSRHIGFQGFILFGLHRGRWRRSSGRPNRCLLSDGAWDEWVGVRSWTLFYSGGHMRVGRHLGGINGVLLGGVSRKDNLLRIGLAGDLVRRRRRLMGLELRYQSLVRQFQLVPMAGQVIQLTSQLSRQIPRRGLLGLFERMKLGGP